MKRSRLERRTPLTATAGLKRTTALGRSPLARSALHADSTGRRRQPKRTTAKNTGPAAKVRALVRERSGGWCEWVGCWLVASEQHHRLNRKQGGRRGEMAARINQAAWLVDACRPHHQLVTSPHGAARQLARESGWLLIEGEDARAVPVLSRHGLVWLADDGSVSTINPDAEEATVNPNYVEELIRIMSARLPECEMDLIDLYVLLALTRGADTTLEDVHSAWAIWRNTSDPEHRSLVPFGQLSREVQELDRRYMEAVHEVAKAAA